MTRNFRQRRCRYCDKHGGDYGQHSGACLPPEVLLELYEYAQANGSRWRSRLREEWFQGGDVLRYLRNAVGPSRLHRIKPPNNRPEGQS